MTALAPLVDAHCHLDREVYGDEQEAVLARAREAGLRWMVTIGVGHAGRDAPLAVAMAEAHADIVATVGIHPHDASEASEAALGVIETLAAHGRVVAVGECGLDYHYDNSPRDTQREVFRKHIAMAKRLQKPLMIHTREAREDTLAVLRDEGARDVGGVIHCFSEDVEFARGALELGFDLSFSGVVTFKRSDEIRAAAKFAPRERILVETDAPYLAPMPNRGKRNEPSWVALTARFLAQTLGVPEDELRALTTANAERRFGLAALASASPAAAS